MTGSSYLLDTNIVSAWLESDRNIAAKIEKADEVFIPVIVIGEMYYGAYFSTKVQANIDNISKVLLRYTALHVDESTCTHYGSVKAALRKKGKPIPENDIWIAAIALQHDLTVVTRDNHFSEIDGLAIERW